MGYPPEWPRAADRVGLVGRAGERRGPVPASRDQYVHFDGARRVRAGRGVRGRGRGGAPRHRGAAGVARGGAGARPTARARGAGGAEGGAEQAGDGAQAAGALPVEGAAPGGDPVIHDVSRRDALRTMAALAVGAPTLLRGRFRLFPGARREYSARAVKLVEETPVIDMLNQFRFADFAERPPKSERWLRDPTTFTRADFETYRTSGIRVFALGQGPGTYEGAVRFFADWNGFIAAHPD